MSDIDAGLTLMKTKGGRDDFNFNILDISTRMLIFSFKGEVTNSRLTTEEEREKNPEYHYVTTYAVAKEDINSEQKYLIHQCLYARRNRKNGYAYYRDGSWVKSLVEIKYVSRIEGY